MNPNKLQGGVHGCAALHKPGSRIRSFSLNGQPGLCGYKDFHITGGKKDVPSGFSHTGGDFPHHPPR